MSATPSTLVSEVVIRRTNGINRMRDVPLYISTTTSRFRTVIAINLPERGDTVEVSMTEAERISLIEALGGTVR